MSAQASFGKTLKRGILGPGTFEQILLKEEEIFNDIKNYADKESIKEKLRDIKFKLDDTAGRKSEKNIQKRAYLQKIYEGLLSLHTGDYGKGWSVEQDLETLSTVRNLSNTTTRSRKLIKNVGQYLKDMEKQTQKIQINKIQELSEKSQKNKERAQKIGQRVLANLGISQKNTYTQAELDSIREYTKQREMVKKRLQISEEQINSDPFFAEIIRKTIQSQSQRLTSPTTGVLGAGTGLKGRKTRKNYRRNNKKTRKH